MKRSLLVVGCMISTYNYKNKKIDFIDFAEHKRGDEWRGGSRGKGGKTKWPRR